MSKNKLILERVLLILLILINAFLIFKNKYFNNFIAVLVLIIDLYSILRYRKNKMLFILFLCILYFDYSVVISKYFYNIDSFKALYAQISYENTKFIGISTLFIMHLITLFILSFAHKTNLEDKRILEFNHKIDYLSKFWLYLIFFLLFLLILNNRVFKIFEISESILEYSIILIIFILYYFQNKASMRTILLLLIVLYSYATMLIGGRVTILQPLLAVYLIFYAHKVNNKKVFIIFILGIITFTIAGLYGDNLETQSNLHDYSNINYVIDVMKDRKFSLDTSYSAYWTGLTFIEMTNKVSNASRLKNCFEFFTKYTLLGSKSDYIKVTSISRPYYVHYYGGFLNCYFYYWLGYLGIAFIGIFLGILLKNVIQLNYASKDYSKILSIYIICTVPRWYLYNPTSLFRGIIFLSIIYFILNKFAINTYNK